MNDPAGPLGLDIWRRGALLGLRLLVVFFVVTLVVWLLLGALGWAGVLRALCAMGVGPFVALGIVGAWWLMRRSPQGKAARQPVEKSE